MFSEKAKELRSSLDDSSPVPTVHNLAIEKRLDKLEKAVFERTVHDDKSGNVPELSDLQPELELVRAIEHPDLEEQFTPIFKPSAREKPSTSQRQRSNQKSSVSLRSIEDSGEKKYGNLINLK